MTLENTILTSLSEWRSLAPGDRTIADATSGWTVQLNVDKCDDLGCRLWEVAVRRTTATAAGTLKDWAAHIAERTQGLTEAVKVIEVDAVRQEAILRSDSPTVRDGHVFYLEILLKGTQEAILRRFRGAAAGEGKREQVHFVLTHESMARLAQSIAHAA